MSISETKFTLSEVIRIIGLICILATQWYLLREEMTSADFALQQRIVKLEQFQDVRVVSDIVELKDVVKEQTERLQAIEDVQRNMWNDIRTSSKRATNN